MGKKLVLGVDFGSDSVRAVLVDVLNGEILSTGVSEYPRWKSGKYQHPDQAIFRQHPLDYLEAFEQCIHETLSKAPENSSKYITGIGVDTTGSTPVPVNIDGTPLSLLEEFSENENAMFYLWKDHSAWKEAKELNEIFSGEGHPNYCKYMGTYSAEWFWAKILHGIRTAPEIKSSAYTWVEHCDWFVGVLCGNTKPETMYHSACAAGYKALWHSEWNGLPDKKVLSEADEYLAKVHERFGKNPVAATVRAGKLTQEWSKKFGLSEEVWVSGSSFDAHAGAVGAGIEEGTLICTLGTSAVDMLVVSEEALKNVNLSALTNYGGLAENSILPELIGIETGQAAFGDIFAWFKRILLWSSNGKDDGQILSRLEKAAQEEKNIDILPISLDWFNGRRYPDTNDFQRGVISNLSLGTTAPQIYYSLVFSAVAGLARICFGFEDAGLKIRKVRAIGGISKKSDFVMQTMSNLLNKEIVILDSDQTCALGAAIYAAMGSGCYDKISQALASMSAKEIRRYYPDNFEHQKAIQLYKKYLSLANKY